MVGIFPPESRPFGISYEGHIINDWKRNLPLAPEVNPMTDPTGARAVNQSGVVYLSGNTGGKTVRNCRIPPGKGVFISLCDVEASEAEFPGKTIEELHGIATSDQDNATNVYLKIDDQEFTFEELKKYRFHTEVFDTVFGSNNLFGAHAGPSKVVADGYYVITEPFSPGNHTIVTKAHVSDPLWDSEVTYNLEVG